MSMPKGFLLSSSNLQDFVECQRRFQLRFMDRLIWPAVEVEPFQEYEHLLHLDRQFHKIIRQHINGISEDQINEIIKDDADLKLWWNNYLKSTKGGTLRVIADQNNQKYEDLTLSVPIDEFRLYAKYDSVIIQPDGKILIFEWITSTTRPDRKWFTERVKNHVYPFVLTRGITGVTRIGPIDPSQVEMIYWFSNQPENPERLGYDQQAYDADSQYIDNLVSAIKQQADPIFPLTPDVRRCMFCVYRSFCDRGVKPGELDQLEAWQEYDPASEDINIDYEQIGELDH